MFSGKTLQEVLKENTVEATQDNLIQLKYHPESVWGYVEVYEFSCLLVALKDSIRTLSQYESSVT